MIGAIFDQGRIMLETLSIKNFKAFSDWQDIKLAPITLIYGPNSSGKSSIIHSIMLLKQSITRPNVQGGLVSNGEYVDLGDFSSMVHGHKREDPIAFKFSYLPTTKQSVSGLDFDVFGKSRKREYELTYRHMDGEKEHKGFSYIDSMSVSVSNADDNAVLFYTEINSALPRKVQELRSDLVKLEKSIESATDKEKNKLLLQLDDFRKKAPAMKIAAAKTFSFSGRKAWSSASEYLKGRPRFNNKEIDIDKLLDYVTFRSDLNYATPSMATYEGKANPAKDAEGVFYLNFTYGSLARDLKDKFSSVTYLGPLRSHPSRIYAPKTDQNDSVGKQGENVARFIYERPEITEDINHWFSSFEVPYELSSAGIGNDVSGPVICLQLKDKRTDVIVGPSDVGFGIGQMLPIIVEGLVRDDSVICVEQPEIHLHPRLQANLANFFVKTCDSNQWIIETHSESLLLRLQAMIARKELSPKKVAIYYVEPTKTGGEIIPIRLDSDGDFIDAWPEGFFEERLKEKYRDKVVVPK
jgi:AAA15 family ATPase/GTPase